MPTTLPVSLLSHRAPRERGDETAVIESGAPEGWTAARIAAATEIRRRTRRRQFVPILLVALAVLPAILLFRALWGSRIAAQMATDINHSGSLRDRSLYIYEVTARSRQTGVSDVRAQYETMRFLVSGLRSRHPAEVRVIDPAWKLFSSSLDRTGTLDWATAKRMRGAADSLTSTLDADAQAEYAQTSVLFALGIAVLALSLPCSFYLTRELATADDENAVQTAELARLSQRYSELFQNIPVACFTYDGHGCIADWNLSSETLFGKSAEEVVGLPLWAAVSRRERWQAAQELVSRVLAGESITGLEWLPDTPDDVLSKTIVTNAFPLRDAEGCVIGGISVNADVTARSAAEEEQKRLMAGIEESERRLSNITSRSHCLLWEASVEEVRAFDDYFGPYWDETQKTVLVWNMTVLQEEETYRWLPFVHTAGQTFQNAWRDSIPPEVVDQMNAISNQALRDGSPRYVQEFPCRLADGTERWLLENVEISRTGEGHFELVGICTDITPQKEAETRLRALATDLERSNRSLQEFAYIASHDLKEPLRKIRTFGGMLSRRAGTALPPECLGYLERMIGATERMQALIDGLLDYSRATRKPRAVGPIDLNEVVRGVLIDLEVTIDRSAAQITIGELPTLKVDPLQMQQLFQNLIGNALKFHQPGKPPVVDVYTDHTGAAMDSVQIVVADRGIGFDSKYAERIFDMFEQLEGNVVASAASIDGSAGVAGAGGDAGTGVGLAICRKIVERHGGTIRAVSRIGEGANFIVTLPLMVSSNTDRQTR